MTDRLEHQYPAVAAALAALTAEEQASAATAAAELALRLTGADVRAPCDEVALTAQVADLDSIAWDLQDEGSDRYPAAFAQARAVHAVLFAVRKEAADAIYEATIAIADESAMLEIVEAR